MEKLSSSNIRSFIDDNLNSTDQLETLHFTSNLTIAFLMLKNTAVTIIYEERKKKHPRMSQNLSNMTCTLLTHPSIIPLPPIRWTHSISQFWSQRMVRLAEHLLLTSN